MTISILETFRVSTDHTIIPAEVELSNFLTANDREGTVSKILQKNGLVELRDYKWSDEFTGVIFKIVPDRYGLFKAAILEIEKVSVEQCTIYEKELNQALALRAELEKPLKEFVDLLNQEIKSLSGGLIKND